MTSGVVPPITWLRTTIGTHILDLFEADGSLKASSEWPGSYTLPNDSLIPAVYVVGSHMVPTEWTVNGIECTIEEVPEITSPGSYSGVISDERWTVRFTNYGTLEGTQMSTTLLDISRRLARAFPLDPVTYMARTDATFEALSIRILGSVINPPIP